MSSPQTRSIAAASFAVAALRGGCVFLLALHLLCGGCDGARNGGLPTDTSAYTTDAGTYVSFYDHLDVGRLLKNDKLVSAYIKCFTNEGPCTVDGRQIKAVLLPEIIRTVCGKCSPRQKDMARQVLKHVYYTRNADFNRIMAIYDTEGKRDQIIAFMNQKK